MANRFHGFGPNIYMHNQQDWINLLGQEAGVGVYGMLLAFRYKRVIVPNGVKIAHGRVID